MRSTKIAPDNDKQRRRAKRAVVPILCPSCWPFYFSAPTVKWIVRQLFRIAPAGSSLRFVLKNGFDAIFKTGDWLLAIFHRPTIFVSG
jgi:hypothetical protein